MRFALAALQGAVFGMLAIHLAGSASFRFVFYSAFALPLLSRLVSARWPRFASLLGLLLVGLWTATCGVAAYQDPSLQGWGWVLLFGVLGLLFGAGANAYLLRGAESLDPDCRRSRPCAGGARPAPPAARDEANAEPPSPARPEADPWSLLGVPPGATPREVAHAFRARIAEYHPDKVASLGVELRELAESKTKAITAAYAALKRRSPL